MRLVLHVLDRTGQVFLKQMLYCFTQLWLIAISYGNSLKICRQQAEESEYSRTDDHDLIIAYGSKDVLEYGYLLEKQSWSLSDSWAIPQAQNHSLPTSVLPGNHGNPASPAGEIHSALPQLFDHLTAHKPFELPDYRAQAGTDVLTVLEMRRKT